MEFLRSALKELESLPTSLYKREGNSGFPLSERGIKGDFDFTACNVFINLN